MKKNRMLALLGVLTLSAAAFTPTAAFAEELTTGADEPGTSGTPWVDPVTGELFLEGADPSEIEYGVAPPTIGLMATGPVQTAGTCKYTHNADLVHVTSGEASGHGWWQIAAGSGNCPATATVKTRLQAWGCWNGSVCGWRTVVTGAGKSIKPGTQKRSNARNVCASTYAVSWRGQVDVDLDWWVDPFGWFTGDQQLINCYPSN